MNRNILSLQFVLIIAAVGALLVIENYYFKDNTPEQSNKLVDSEQQAPLELQRITRHKVARSAEEDLSQYLISTDTSLAAKGITVIPLSGPDKIWVIDNNGKLLHEWLVDAERARLLPDGNILVGFGSKFRDGKPPWKNLLNTLAEFDWQGNLVWQYTSKDWIHHDHQRLESGNTLFLKKTQMPAEILQEVKDPHRRSVGQVADSIIEVNPAGEIVWQWDAWESFDVNECGTRSCEKSIDSFTEMFDDSETSKKDKIRAEKKIEDWAHFNTVNVVPANKHFDNGDQRFRPGNLIIMPRKFKTVYILDKQTKQLVWSYSGDYKGGIGGAHEPHMIEKGLPGAGNILIFDNGGLGSHSDESYVLEVDPISNKVVWAYAPGPEFNIRTRGSTQRLANGNTLISEDPTGKVLEVTPKGEVIWQFNSPHPINRARRYPESFRG